MLGSKLAVGCSKGKMTLRFLTKGTWCGVGSEVIHRGMELRDRNIFDGLDRFQKKSQGSELQVFFVHLRYILN